MEQKPSKAELIIYDLVSRPNALNGKYKVAQIGVDCEEIYKEKDLFFLETLRLKADLTDESIKEAEEQGKNTNDPNVIRELGEQINYQYKPIHHYEAIGTAILVSLELMIAYGSAIGIWGIVFKKNFLGFSLYGLIIGFLISLFSAGPVIVFQRTEKRIRDIIFGVGLTWGILGIIISSLGVVAIFIRMIFVK